MPSPSGGFSSGCGGGDLVVLLHGLVDRRAERARHQVHAGRIRRRPCAIMPTTQNRSPSCLGVAGRIGMRRQQHRHSHRHCEQRRQTIWAFPLQRPAAQRSRHEASWPRSRHRRQRVAVDVARLRRQQESDRRGDFLGLSVAGLRHVGKPRAPFLGRMQRAPPSAFRSGRAPRNSRARRDCRIPAPAPRTSA